MRITIVIQPNGAMTFFGQDGNLLEGEAKINQLLTAVAATGLTIESTTPVESHREGEYVYDHAHELAHQIASH